MNVLKDKLRCIKISTVYLSQHWFHLGITKLGVLHQQELGERLYRADMEAKQESGLIGYCFKPSQLWLVVFKFHFFRFKCIYDRLWLRFQFACVGYQGIRTSRVWWPPCLITVTNVTGQQEIIERTLRALDTSQVLINLLHLTTLEEVYSFSPFYRRGNWNVRMLNILPILTQAAMARQGFKFEKSPSRIWS